MRGAGEVFDEFAALTAGQAVRLLRASATRVWAPTGRSSGRCRARRPRRAPARLYADGRFPTADGRARFVAGRARGARRAGRRIASR